MQVALCTCLHRLTPLRLAQLTVAEVRGEEGVLWYEDERDAEWVVDKLEGACERWEPALP